MPAWGYSSASFPRATLPPFGVTTPGHAQSRCLDMLLLVRQNRHLGVMKGVRMFGQSMGWQEAKPLSLSVRGEIS